MTAFSRDHKVIGVQYALTAMVFLLLGFALPFFIWAQLITAFPLLRAILRVVSPDDFARWLASQKQ